MFLSEHDYSPLLLAHVRAFTEKQPPYLNRLAYWERNDFFLEQPFKSCEPLIRPFKFVDSATDSILSADPVTTSDREAYMAWLIRVNDHRLHSRWDIQLGEQSVGTIEALFFERYSDHVLFREAYNAAYKHELPDYVAFLASSDSHMPLIQVVLAVMWLNFNVRRREPHLHTKLE